LSRGVRRRGCCHVSPAADMAVSWSNCSASNRFLGGLKPRCEAALASRLAPGPAAPECLLLLAMLLLPALLLLLPLPALLPLPLLLPLLVLPPATWWWPLPPTPPLLAQPALMPCWPPRLATLPGVLLPLAPAFLPATTLLLPEEGCLGRASTLPCRRQALATAVTLPADAEKT
jgi:hypothetical protein